jgi:hypothetical protein
VSATREHERHREHGGTHSSATTSGWNGQSCGRPVLGSVARYTACGAIRAGDRVSCRTRLRAPRQRVTQPAPPRALPPRTLQCGTDGDRLLAPGRVARLPNAHRHQWRIRARVMPDTVAGPRRHRTGFRSHCPRSFSCVRESTPPFLQRQAERTGAPAG